MRHAHLRVTHVRGLSTTEAHRVPERKLIFPGSVWRHEKHRKRLSRLAGSADVPQACNIAYTLRSCLLCKFIHNFELSGIIKKRDAE